VVELEPQSHGRVTRTTPLGAEVLLENGRARVEVVHRPKTDWRILAGPYTVRVTGTSFEVGFEERTQTLEVIMRSGTVLVEGPGISNPVEIQGAQRFTHRAGLPEASNGSLRLPSSEPGTQPQASVTSEPTSPGAPQAVARPSGNAGNGSTNGSGPASWAALAARGHYQAVLEQADRLGIGKALNTTKATDLMALGHAARFSGRTDLAARAYQATRARFGGTSDAANAAFFLGRMVEGQSPNMAIGWYERYVSEAPRGTWVAEAWGRRVVLLKKTGAQEAALEAARQYQERFPKGPYAGVAREMTTPP
jgi:TolA-binding protein